MTQNLNYIELYEFCLALSRKFLDFPISDVEKDMNRLGIVSDFNHYIIKYSEITIKDMSDRKFISTEMNNLKVRFNETLDSFCNLIVGKKGDDVLSDWISNVNKNLVQFEKGYDISCRNPNFHSSSDGLFDITYLVHPDKRDLCFPNELES